MVIVMETKSKRKRRMTAVELAPLLLPEYDGTTWATQFGQSPTDPAIETEWKNERTTRKTVLDLPILPTK